MSKRRKMNSRRRYQEQVAGRNTGRVTPPLIDARLPKAPSSVHDCLFIRNSLFEAYEGTLDVLADERLNYISERIVNDMVESASPDSSLSSWSNISQDDARYWFDKSADKMSAYHSLAKIAKKLGYQLESDQDNWFVLYLTCRHAQCWKHDLQTMQDNFSIPAADRIASVAHETESVKMARGWKAKKRAREIVEYSLSDLMTANRLQKERLERHLARVL